MEFTEQQISAVARALSDRAAGDCGVHKEDNWDIYSDYYLEDAKAALAAASAAAPQVVADEPTAAQMDKWYESASSAHQSLRADRYAFGCACYRAGMEAKKNES